MHRTSTNEPASPVISWLASAPMRLICDLLAQKGKGQKVYARSNCHSTSDKSANSLVEVDYSRNVGQCLQIQSTWT
jgi:hypothetical protein